MQGGRRTLGCGVWATSSISWLHGPSTEMPPNNTVVTLAALYYRQSLLSTVGVQPFCWWCEVWRISIPSKYNWQGVWYFFRFIPFPLHFFLHKGLAMLETVAGCVCQSFESGIIWVCFTGDTWFGKFKSEERIFLGLSHWELTLSYWLTQIIWVDLIMWVMGVYFKSTFLFEANTNAPAASEISNVMFIFCLFHLKPHVWPLCEDLRPNVISCNR